MSRSLLTPLSLESEALLTPLSLESEAPLTPLSLESEDPLTLLLPLSHTSSMISINKKRKKLSDSNSEINTTKKRKELSDPNSETPKENNKKIITFIDNFQNILSTSTKTKSLSKWVDSLIRLIEQNEINTRFINLKFGLVRNRIDWSLTSEKTQHSKNPQMDLTIMGNSTNCNVDAFDKVEWRLLSPYILSIQCDRGCTFNAQIVDIFKEDPNIKNFSIFHRMCKAKFNNFDQVFKFHFENLEKMGFTHLMPSNITNWLTKHPKLQDLTFLLQQKPLEQDPIVLFNILDGLQRSRPINGLTLQKFNSDLQLPSSTSFSKISLNELSVLPAKLTKIETFKLRDSPISSLMSTDTLTNLLEFFEPETLESLTIQFPLEPFTTFKKFHLNVMGILSKHGKLRCFDVVFSDMSHVLFHDALACIIESSHNEPLKTSLFKSLWFSYQKTNTVQRSFEYFNFIMKLLSENLLNFRCCLSFSLPIILEYLF